MLKDEHTLDPFDDHMPAVHQTHISERKRLGLLVVLFALFHTTIVTVSRQNKPITGSFLIAKSALKTSLLMFLGGCLVRLRIDTTNFSSYQANFI